MSSRTLRLLVANFVFMATPYCFVAVENDSVTEQLINASVMILKYIKYAVIKQSELMSLNMLWPSRLNQDIIFSYVFTVSTSNICYELLVLL